AFLLPALGKIDIEARSEGFASARLAVRLLAGRVLAEPHLRVKLLGLLTSGRRLHCREAAECDPAVLGADLVLEHPPGAAVAEAYPETRQIVVPFDMVRLAGRQFESTG